MTAFEESLRQAESELADRDEVLRVMIERHGPCTIRPHRRHFETLVGSIISQQLSTGAAETILRRFRAIYDTARFPKPSDIIATPDEPLRAAGLSGQKISYIRDLAEKAHRGDLRLSRLEQLDDEEVIEILTTVRGIGVWTAHMFLIFSLARLDVLPVGDLGIRKAIRNACGLTELPDPATIERIAAERRWAPYRSVATWFLWRSLGKG